MVIQGDMNLISIWYLLSFQIAQWRDYEIIDECLRV